MDVVRGGLLALISKGVIMDCLLEPILRDVATDCTHDVFAILDERAAIWAPVWATTAEPRELHTAFPSVRAQKCYATYSLPASHRQ